MDLGAWFQTLSFTIERLKFLEDCGSKKTKNYYQESCKWYNMRWIKKIHSGKLERQDQEL